MNLSPTPNYVFIHIGNPLPVSLKLSINSVIKSSQQMAHIYLITDQNCIFPKFVNIVKVDLGKKQYIYEKLTKIYNSDVLRARGGYWYKSLLRYFFLYDWFLENQDIEHLIHVESDALVYIDNEMYELLVNRYNKISVAKNTSGKHVPTVILVPNRSSFDKAMSFIESDVFKNQQNTFFIPTNMR